MQLSPPEYVIRVFGGVRATARALNVTPAAISKWHQKQFIPTKRISQIVRIADEMGLDITSDDLIRGREIRISEM